MYIRLHNLSPPPTSASSIIPQQPPPAAMFQPSSFVLSSQSKPQRLPPYPHTSQQTIAVPSTEIQNPTIELPAPPWKQIPSIQISTVSPSPPQSPSHISSASSSPNPAFTRLSHSLSFSSRKNHSRIHHPSPPNPFPPSPTLLQVPLPRQRCSPIHTSSTRPTRDLAPTTRTSLEYISVHIYKVCVKHDR